MILLGVLLFLAVVVAYTFTTTPAPKVAKYLLVAVLIGGSAFGWDLVADKMGYAVSVQFPKSRLIAYNVVLEGAEKKSIELWLSHGETRLYVIPYTKQAEEELESGSAKAQGGGVLTLEQTEKGLHADILTPQQANPKLEQQEAPREWDRSSV